MKTYEVKLFYSGYCTYTIEAEDESDAFVITNAKNLDEDEAAKNEILGTLERWEEADTIEEIE